MSKYYDEKNNQLVCIYGKPSQVFWETHWKNQNLEKYFPKKILFFDPIIYYSKKYIPGGKKILEGGCGVGQNVHKLNLAGFKTTGVDFAENTIKITKNKFPNLDLRHENLENLSFADEFFDAYWSIGVIEHGFYGFDKIFREMKRVLKKDGYLFLSFPHMSTIRKLKAKLNMYPKWNFSRELIPDFYQYILDENRVMKKIEKNGFIFQGKIHLDGFGGLIREISFVNYLLKPLVSSRSLLATFIKLVISYITKHFTSHSILLIFKKS